MESHEVIISLIANTTTEAGLRVEASLDRRSYPLRQTVDEDQLAAVQIKPAKFHGDWNYTIQPSK